MCASKSHVQRTKRPSTGRCIHLCNDASPGPGPTEGAEGQTRSVLSRAAREARRPTERSSITERETPTQTTWGFDLMSEGRLRSLLKLSVPGPGTVPISRVFSARVSGRFAGESGDAPVPPLPAWTGPPTSPRQTTGPLILYTPNSRPYSTTCPALGPLGSGWELQHGHS